MTDDLSRGEAEKDLVDMIRERYDAGMGRNAIAKAVGASTWKVSQICQANGWDFDQERTRRAVEVHVASAGEQRRKLAGRFRSVAEVALNNADDHSDDAAELFGWLKAAGTAVDKDLAIQQQLDRVDDHSSMQDAVDSFTAFGALVRGTAAAQRGEEPP
ncbi:hypothetical protein ACTXM9_04595 [Corynebacterium variabile]|uniref:hypothetical protein n=1 Tax=Corynebacterium variabile TaxID=1727 RepID=UPI003FCF7B39